MVAPHLQAQDLSPEPFRAVGEYPAVQEWEPAAFRAPQAQVLCLATMAELLVVAVVLLDNKDPERQVQQAWVASNNQAGLVVFLQLVAVCLAPLVEALSSNNNSLGKCSRHTPFTT